MEWLVMILRRFAILIELVQEVQGPIILCTIFGSSCELDPWFGHLVQLTLC